MWEAALTATILNENIMILEKQNSEFMCRKPICHLTQEIISLRWQNP